MIFAHTKKPQKKPKQSKTKKKSNNPKTNKKQEKNPYLMLLVLT
jgi:hypothetical protein